MRLRNQNPKLCTYLCTLMCTFSMQTPCSPGSGDRTWVFIGEVQLPGSADASVWEIQQNYL